MEGSNDKKTVRIEERDKTSRYHLSDSFKRNNRVSVDATFLKLFLRIPVFFI